jgi:hypothetical protein
VQSRGFAFIAELAKSYMPQPHPHDHVYRLRDERNDFTYELKRTNKERELFRDGENIKKLLPPKVVKFATPATLQLLECFAENLGRPLANGKLQEMLGLDDIKLRKRLSHLRKVLGDKVPFQIIELVNNGAVRCNLVEGGRDSDKHPSSDITLASLLHTAPVGMIRAVDCGARGRFGISRRGDSNLKLTGDADQALPINHWYRFQFREPGEGFLTIVQRTSTGWYGMELDEQRDTKRACIERTGSEMLIPAMREYFIEDQPGVVSFLFVCTPAPIEEELSRKLLKSANEPSPLDVDLAGFLAAVTTQSFRLTVCFQEIDD